MFNGCKGTAFFETNKYIAEYFSNKSSLFSYQVENERNNDETFS